MNIKKFLVIVISLASLVAQAQGRHTSHKVTQEDIQDFLEDTRMDIVQKANDAVVAGNLKAYAAKPLKKALTVNEYNAITTWTEEVQAKVPIYLDDPAELHDVVILSQHNYSNALGMSLADTSALEIIFSPERKVYFRMNEVWKFLSPADIAVIEYLKAKKQTLLDNKLVESMAAGIFNTLKKTLYNLPFEKNLHAYTNDSLTSRFTKEGLKERGRWDEVKFFPQPGTRPEDGMGLDTVVVKYFEPDSIKTVHLLYETTTGDFDINARLLALAPGYTPNIGGIWMPDIALFWLKQQDAMRYFDKVSLELYRHVFHFGFSYNLENK